MIGKKKVSIDFSEPEYKLMVEKAKKEGKSNSAVINSLVSLILRLSPDVADMIGSYCYEEYQKETAKLEQQSGYERNETQKRADQFYTVSSYFGIDRDSYKKKTGMCFTFLKNGYVTYPKDWIILENVFGPTDDCMYAGCVECRNAGKYNIPHFIFFCNQKYANEYSDEMVEKIYAACARAYPEFKKLFNMQVPNPNLKSQESLKKWNDAPCFGIFHIIEKDDPLYWHNGQPNYKPPYGAMIVRETD